MCADAVHLQYGNTVFHYAALAGKVKVLEILLNKAEADGGDMGRQSQKGRCVSVG